MEGIMAIRKLSWHTMRRVLFAGIREKLAGITSNDLRAQVPKGNVILLHGWREHMNSPTFLPLGFALRDAGYNVLMFDFPNHGGNVTEESDRGHVSSFWSLVYLVRIIVFRVLLSRSRGKLPTYVLGYSMGALTLMLLLVKKMLLRRGIAGAIFVSIPLRVTHNASEAVRRFEPAIRAFRGILKRLKPRHPVSESRQRNPDDPNYYYGPANLCTAIEIYDAAAAVTAPGKMELLAQVAHIAFLHGKDDDVAPSLDALSGFRRIVGESPNAYVEFQREDGVTKYETLDSRHILHMYAGIGHDIFAHSDVIVSDIATVLDRWSAKGDFVPIFADEDSGIITDITDFVFWAIHEIFAHLWNARHRLFALLRFRRR
jgi:alpha-beta hydrolase superfamily lysophospholipase